MVSQKFIKGLIFGSIISAIANLLTYQEIGIPNIIVAGVLTGVAYHYFHQI